MAWQSPSGMGGGGGAGGDGSNPAGTEYTLQGVMRFLQIEWHNHERARNAWDIERAEMTAKIAKQEGELRSHKHLNESLTKQIRMLELALKSERAKNKALAAGEKPPAEPDKKDAKGKAGLKPEPRSGTRAFVKRLPRHSVLFSPPDDILEANHAASTAMNKHQNSFLDLDSDTREAPIHTKEAQRDKSKLFLTKCVEEMTYLLTPPAHPPPQANLQSLPGSSYVNQTEALLMELKSQQQVAGSFSHPSSMSNHHPPTASASDMANISHQPQQAAFMTRERSNQHLMQPNASQSFEINAPGSQPHQQGGMASAFEEQVEKVTHSFDVYGKPVTARDEDVPGTRQMPDEADEWNFDEGNSLGKQPPEMPQNRRPTDLFPSATSIPSQSPPRAGPPSHRRKSSGSAAMARRRSEGHESQGSVGHPRPDQQQFKVRFALRGHLDVVRSVIFTGGGSPSEPEICTAGDDGMIKRWIIPASYGNLGQHAMGSDLDIQSYFTHRGHEGMVTCLAACPATNFSTGGRVSGDGWIFSGGQDATIRVWERGRVDPKATLDGHTDVVWAVCVLPAACGSVFGSDSPNFGGPDRILLASGSADGTVKIWSVSAPPSILSPQTGPRRGVGGTRRHSVTSGSNFPSSPQPTVATSTPCHYTLIHSVERPGTPSPTCISPLSIAGETFVVSYTNAEVLIFDTRTGEAIIGMASTETYDGTRKTGINAVVATTVGPEGTMGADSGRGASEDETVVHGPTGSSAGGGVEGVIISGHEDQFIRFYDANSGQCTYNMLAHPSAISSLSLSKDGREAVSAGHDASIRFWSLEKRICTQEITSHRIMRGEGVCSVVWSQDGRLVVSAGGDGVVKVFAR